MDIFSIGVLARVIAELPAPAPFILNSFFTAMQTETSEEIHFDVENGRRRVYCDTCSRTHLRAMEGKLDSEFW